MKYDWTADPGARRQLAMHEGYRDRIYRDTVGKMTVGIGRNVTDVPFSPDEIDLMFSNDLRRAQAGLDKIAPWWRDLDVVRQRVLLDMCFNMGARTLAGFKNTLAAIRDGRFDDAAGGMEASRWSSQVGGRAVRLVAMMRTGELPPELTAPTTA